MREIVTTPATMGTINEHEMVRTSRLYSYPAGPMEQGHGIVNASVPELAEVHHNEAVGETDAAQVKLVCRLTSYL